MSKKLNVYSFNDEYYVYLGDYKQLQNNWNELKEWLKEIQINGVYIDEWTIIEVRNKVEEIES